jgi:U-box domain
VPPASFLCPVSMELMVDPVIVATGHTYDRSCIEKWLQQGNKTCPVTGMRLRHMELTPNYALKNAIQVHKALTWLQRLIMHLSRCFTPSHPVLDTFTPSTSHLHTQCFTPSPPVLLAYCLTGWPLKMDQRFFLSRHVQTLTTFCWNECSEINACKSC